MSDELYAATMTALVNRIEDLEAEVERLRNGLVEVNQYADELRAQRDRLAEALQRVEHWFAGKVAVNYPLTLREEVRAALAELEENE